MQHRTRECDRVRVAFAGEAFDLRAAGILEPEQACDLVERLARRVVARLAEPFPF